MIGVFKKYRIFITIKRCIPYAVLTSLAMYACIGGLTATNISINLICTQASVETRITGTFVDICVNEIFGGSLCSNVLKLLSKHAVLMSMRVIDSY